MDFRAGWLRLPARKSGCLRLFCVTLDSRLNAARALSCPRSTAYTFSQHAYSTPGATHHYASSIKRPHPHRRWSCAFVVALRALRPERHKQGQRRKRRAVTPRMNVPKPAVLLCRGQQLTTRTRSTPGQLQRLLNRLLQAVCSAPFLVPWTCRRIASGWSVAEANHKSRQPSRARYNRAASPDSRRSYPVKVHSTLNACSNKCEASSFSAFLEHQSKSPTPMKGGASRSWYKARPNHRLAEFY